MKKCPICQRTYSDPTLNFCLDDGATLIAATGDFGQQGQNFATLFPAGRPKKSKPIFWVLGVLGVVAVIGVTGLVGLIALIANNNNGSSGNGRRIANAGNNANGGVYSTNFKVSNGVGNSSPKNAESIDFKRWGERKTDMGETKLVGDELQISAAKPNYYYVVIASTKFDDKYLTNDTIVKVTTHSVTGASPSLGYGLIINSDIEPLKSDYAFLIRSDNQTYRVARHQNDKENTVDGWTYAPQIRTGTQTNQLEVRSLGNILSFYINGQLATTLTDKSEAEQGIVGLYTSDNAPIGFSDLQIIKK